MSTKSIALIVYLEWYALHLVIPVLQRLTFAAQSGGETSVRCARSLQQSMSITKNNES
jgi:hypothetical protein